MIRFDRWELAGAVADLGVLVPIAVAMMIKNGLSPTAVLLPAGLLYLAAAYLYRLPIPVQPLKAFGAIAIANGLGVDEIASGALLMGVVFVVLGASGLIDFAARAFPKPLVRGVQVTVGLLFLKIAWNLVSNPPASFHDQLPSRWLVPVAVLLLLTLALRRRVPVTLVLVGSALLVAGVTGGVDGIGPSDLALPSFDGATFWTAFTVLVVPQLPLSFANSCLATADAARTYFGAAAQRVRAGKLAMSFGTANLLAGAIGGMPVCHGAGGLTAHYSSGARTAGAPLVLGTALVAVAIGVGAGLATFLASFPLPVLAALLAGAGLLHLGLLRDLRRARDVGLAVAIGVLGFETNLALALACGLVVWWGATFAARRIQR